MLFNKFETDKIITWLTFDLMKRKENFVMIFGDRPDILSEREYKEWLNTHEDTKEQDIILFTKQNGGYTLIYNHSVKDVLIPNDLLQLNHNDFLKKAMIA